MSISEESQHTLLLVIAALLFIIFVLGLEPESNVSEEPIVIPSA